MTPSHDLHTLIKSLTRNEKRYFKRFATFQSDAKENAYAKLFDVISEQELYNEGEVIARFGVKHFTQHKQHLHQKVLESLRMFHSGKEVDQTVNQLIAESILVRKKGLIKSAVKLLEKADKIAMHHELFYKQLEIIQLKTELYSLLETDAFSNKLASTERRSKQLLEQIHLFEKISGVYLRTLMTNRSTEFFRSEKEYRTSLGLVEICKKSGRMNSIRSKVRLLYIMGIHHYLSCEFRQSLICFNEAVGLFETHEVFKQCEEEFYIRCLSNAVLMKIKLSESGIENDLSLFERHESEFYEKTILQRAKLLKALLYYYQPRKESDRKLLIHLEGDEYGNNNNEAVTEKWMWLFCSLSYYIFNKEPKKALKLLNTYLNESDHQAKTDVYCLSKVIYLLIHFQLGNNDLLEYQLSSTKRYLSKKERIFKFEKIMLGFIKNSLKFTSEKERSIQLKELLSHLKKLKSERFESAIFEYFPIESYINLLSSSSKAN